MIEAIVPRAENMWYTLLMDDIIRQYKERARGLLEGSKSDFWQTMWVESIIKGQQQIEGQLVFLATEVDSLQIDDKRGWSNLVERMRDEIARGKRIFLTIAELDRIDYVRQLRNWVVHSLYKEIGEVPRSVDYSRALKRQPPLNPNMTKRQEAYEKFALSYILVNETANHLERVIDYKMK